MGYGVYATNPQARKRKKLFRSILGDAGKSRRFRFRGVVESETMKTRTEIVKGLAGGNGEVVKKHILTAEELNDKTRMFAEITLAPGCSIGYHEHHGESETYYILAGTGAYDDNGEKRAVVPGDVTFTPSGKGHGLANAGTDDLVFIALILRD